ncbi:pyridoxal 5'-phosphate synthase glutaminase subunit PdxT [Candidatus Venteria ishoeyi]|uniref:pyridoxal 5'-phosphate synthase glutaminase subunit PdxT n=1 Tax=Candidatus Venteria ishoeyi TaxID=1899563 RepID=UPI0025A5E8D9|nr:pyridoxal 5'-phosphate synthase glutaminase subunit PdxT [Candidatus Venteria ishoeyi]MDM8546175.1 pyridoxal 5'-phosphate synthase glutaminase subunit PdxT [Candidatus Venteria ishoeyi]
MTRIGVLDLQGGVAEHVEHLRRLGVCAVRIKKEADFEGIAGLIIPGGESSCISRLLRLYGLERVIYTHYAAGLKLWGSCAGAILLAKNIIGEETSHLALIDIDIQRNAFGSQLDSFTIEEKIPDIDENPIPLTFIRAPKITRLGDGVRALLTMGDYVAAAEDMQTLVTVFHPELTPNLAFHRYFCQKCGLDIENKTGQDMAFE